MTAAWKNFGATALDLLFPPLCLSCRAPVGSEGGFCAECWGTLTFLDGPACACCGTPFPADPGPESLCAACLAKLPAFTRARAILAYDEASRGATPNQKAAKWTAASVVLNGLAAVLGTCPT